MTKYLLVENGVLMSLLNSTVTSDERTSRGGSFDPADLPPTGQFIGGSFHQTADTEIMDVINPATESVIAQVPLGTAADVDLAVQSALKARVSWARIVPRDRSEILHSIADRMVTHREVLARLESGDTGKPMSVARDDIDGTVDTFRFMAGALRAPTSLAAGDYVEAHLSVILREPLGVIGAITPWNYPLGTAAQKIAAILGAGNCMVLKPSEQTPLSTLKFAELTADLLPPGVLNVVNGLGPEVGAALATHPDVAMISLTGSTASGRAVARAAADSLKRVHLELGGKAAVIVSADADLDLVATTLRTASFYNSGQDCGAACRVIAHQDIAEELIEKLVSQVRQIRVGDPAEDVEIGPVVSKEHYERVLDHLQRAYADGARAAIGGEAIEGIGYYIQPTVLVDMPSTAACLRDEIFGPVITVQTFGNDDEAVRLANDTDLGLSASVWTKDARRSHDFAARLDAGTVWVNSHGVYANEMPWAGFKGSGYGRDMSAYALDDYSRTKHVMHNHGN